MKSPSVTNSQRLRAILTEVAKHGWTFIDQQLEMGVRSVTAPIRNGNGQAIAAMSVSEHASRGSAADVKREFLPAVLEASGRITAALAMRR